MNQINSSNKFTDILRSESGIILIFVLAKFLIHFYTNAFAGYGIYRDELYFLSCAARPALGYVDQPPLSIWFLGIYKSLFGDSVFAIRMIPAILGAMTVWISGRVTQKMGGGRTALLLSLTGVLLAPIYLAMNSFYSMNSIDIFLWALTFYFMVRLSEEHSAGTWIILGLVLGLGLMNKLSFLWLAFGLVHSYMIITRGKVFLKRGIWLAGLISGLLFLPFIIWNLQHDMAHWEFMKNARNFKYAGITRAGFIKDVFLILNPLSALIWIPGGLWFFFKGRKKEIRVIGLTVVFVITILLINGKSKAEYVAAAMIPLFAAGGIFYEQLKRQAMKRVLAWGVGTSIFVSGIILAPMALPVLPVKRYIPYAETLGISTPSTEGKQLAALPQFYADMHGWEEMAECISKVYLTIPEGERAFTVFWGANYGRAGAIEYFSDKYPLPRAVSPHNSFWLWGLGEEEIRHVIFLGGNKNDYETAFETVAEKGVHRADYAMPYENNQPIYLCSGFKGNASKIWTRVKNFN